MTFGRSCFSFAALALALGMDSTGRAADQVLPFLNSHLADSNYPLIHPRAGMTTLPGPIGPSRNLSSGEIIHKRLGPMNTAVPLYSAPYPDGRRVVWVGVFDRLAKLDAETLEILTTHALGGTTYYGDEELQRHLKNLDTLEGREFLDYIFDLWREPFLSVDSVYHVLTADNQLIMPYRSPDGTVSLRVYGEEDSSDPASRIRLVREWPLPGDISRAVIASVNLVSDGTIVLATQDGVIVALAEDFSSYQKINLPRREAGELSRDFFAAYVRNGVVTDDRGGIYVVTRDFMHRVQWTGKELSLAGEQGGWSVPYANETGFGSGSTPALMGWADNEDKLVIIPDASVKTNALAIWRDEIPQDWEGLEGYDRRVAGVAPITFGLSENEAVSIENTPIIYGNGVFFNNAIPQKAAPRQDTPTRQWLLNSYSMKEKGRGANGAVKLVWNKQTRRLETAWRNADNFASSVCTVSSATNFVYCWGARDGKWTVEAVDWNSGESAFHYVLGDSNRFSPLGCPIIIAPNGSIDCGCIGGLGMVRVRPKK